MGEYATIDGKSVKIGTCEDLYYLRADQAHRVEAENGSVDPMDEEHRKSIRFRFPFPDEDHIEPGCFKDYNRGLALTVPNLPPEIDHATLQFKARPYGTPHDAIGGGYLVSLPCPNDSSVTDGPRIARNGVVGTVRLVQQAYRNGYLAVVCECVACGRKFNLPTAKEAAPIAEACVKEAEREMRSAEQLRNRGHDPKWHEERAEFWTTVGRRVLAGYRKAVTV